MGNYLFQVLIHGLPYVVAAAILFCVAVLVLLFYSIHNADRQQRDLQALLQRLADAHAAETKLLNEKLERIAAALEKN